MRRGEQQRIFGEFVRAKRHCLSPPHEDRRRRTPGLRREELAQKAGISAIWCAWIEQGRPSGISDSALVRLALALDLSAEDRARFFQLSGKADPGDAQIKAQFSGPSILTSLVMAIGSPAYVIDGKWDAACWNDLAGALFPAWLGKGCDRNLLRYAMLNGGGRTVTPLWRDWARSLVGEFRKDVNSAKGAALLHLAARLTQDSRLFQALWNEDVTESPESQVRIFSRPGGGDERYLQMRWRPPEHPDHTVVVLLTDGVAV